MDPGHEEYLFGNVTSEPQDSACRIPLVDGGDREGMTIRYVRMQRPFDVDFLATLSSSFYDLEVPCNCPSLLIIQKSSFLVTNPCVSTSST